MLNAEYPAQVSKHAKDELTTKIEALGLSGLVEIDTTFYSDEDCLYLLSEAHLIVFAYQDTPRGCQWRTDCCDTRTHF